MVRRDTRPAPAYTPGMLVYGGRSWVRVASLVGSLGALGLVSMAGCGGRTSTLDPDAYDPDFGAAANGGSMSGGGTSAGGSKPSGSAGKPISTAGKSSGTGGSSVIGVSGSGTGGTGTKPPPTTGGKSGGGSLDPSQAVVPCQSYCPGYVTDCRSKLLPGQDCVASCEAEVNGSGVSCQKLGISSLECLTPFFTLGLACDTAISQGLIKCGQLVYAFQNCKGSSAPTPTPVPTPTIDIGSCPAMGDFGAGLSQCKAVFSCPQGQFETYCQQRVGTNTSDCSCVGLKAGQTTTTTLMNQPDLCRAAAGLCAQ